MKGRTVKRLTGIGVAVILIIAVSWIISSRKKISETKEIVISIPEPKILYGLKAESFHIEESFVDRNENLSDILTNRGVSSQIIDKIAHNSLAVFDVRKMKAGNRFTVFYTPDSARIPRYLVYENNAVDYYVFDLRIDSVKAGKKEVIVKRKAASGMITSSLWNAIKENNLSPALALGLSEIYAWTIDFFSIQSGDSFRVIYDEEFIKGESIGIGKIHTASFIHSGVEYFAIRFIQEDGENYFDEKGNNLRRSFLKSPLKFSARISSRFSTSRFHPILRISRPHYGVDYAAPSGTPVYSIGDGVVTHKGYQASGGGNFIKIRHNSIYETTYMHLLKFVPAIHQGSRVRQGEMIGFVGMTGLATGPHLDFRVFMGGSPVDPLKIKSPPAEPVKNENFNKFTVVRDSLLKELNKGAYVSEMPLIKK